MTSEKIIASLRLGHNDSEISVDHQSGNNLQGFAKTGVCVRGQGWKEGLDIISMKWEVSDRLSDSPKPEQATSRAEGPCDVSIGSSCGWVTCVTHSQCTLG